VPLSLIWLRSLRTSLAKKSLTFYKFQRVFSISFQIKKVKIKFILTNSRSKAGCHIKLTLIFQEIPALNKWVHVRRPDPHRRARTWRASRPELSSPRRPGKASRLGWTGRQHRPEISFNSLYYLLNNLCTLYFITYKTLGLSNFKRKK